MHFRNTPDGKDNGMHSTLETKLLIFGLLLLVVAWLGVMHVTGKNWWGFDDAARESIETPDFSSYAPQGQNSQ